MLLANGDILFSKASRQPEGGSQGLSITNSLELTASICFCDRGLGGPKHSSSVQDSVLWKPSPGQATPPERIQANC